MNVAHRIIDDGTKNVRSLVWEGEDLVDWCQGGVRWDAHGKRHDSRVMTAFSFDAAVRSPSGEYASSYLRTGTKGVIWRTGTRRVVRELNRSFYWANVYEFPIVFTRIGDREVVIYCPEKYNRLEIEDLETGERLGYSNRYAPTEPRPSCETRSRDTTDNPDQVSGEGKTRKPVDVFHSRLAISPGGNWLISNGWIWQPYDAFELFPLAECGVDARRLDKRQWRLPGNPTTQSAAFLDSERIVAGLGEAWYDERGEEIRGQTREGPLNTLAVWRVGDENFSQVVHLERQTGTLLPLSDTEVVDLFGHPKVIVIQTGQVVRDWPEIATGQQVSSIIRDKHPPPTAFDPAQRRLAVHDGRSIHVISLD